MEIQRLVSAWGGATLRTWGMAQASGFPLPSTKGRLLVAAPPLGDPNFDRTVVFMLEHNEGGAIGVVLNRRSDDLDVELDTWAELVAPPRELFTGGPVEANALIALGKVRLPSGEVSVEPVDLEMDPAFLDPRPTTMRIFHGYSGWSAQQLDGELELGAWIVVPSKVDDVFTENPEDLWAEVLKRQPGRVSWLASAPTDLSTN